MWHTQQWIILRSKCGRRRPVTSHFMWPSCGDAEWRTGIVRKTRSLETMANSFCAVINQSLSILEENPTASFWEDWSEMRRELESLEVCIKNTIIFTTGINMHLLWSLEIGFCGRESLWFHDLCQYAHCAQLHFNFNLTLCKQSLHHYAFYIFIFL